MSSSSTQTSKSSSSSSTAKVFTFKCDPRCSPLDNSREHLTFHLDIWYLGGTQSTAAKCPGLGFFQRPGLGLGYRPLQRRVEEGAITTIADLEREIEHVDSYLTAWLEHIVFGLATICLVGNVGDEEDDVDKASSKEEKKDSSVVIADENSTYGSVIEMHETVMPIQLPLLWDDDKATIIIPPQTRLLVTEGGCVFFQVSSNSEDKVEKDEVKVKDKDKDLSESESESVASIVGRGKWLSLDLTYWYYNECINNNKNLVSGGGGGGSSSLLSSSSSSSSSSSNSGQRDITRAVFERLAVTLTRRQEDQ